MVYNRYCVNHLNETNSNYTILIMAVITAWHQPLVESIESELATEHAKIPELPACDLTWVTDQIRAVLDNHNEYSYEEMYRAHFNWCIQFRIDNNLTRPQYRYALGFLYDFVIPRQVIVLGLKHKGGGWLAHGLAPLEKFQQMMREICLYPRNQLDAKLFWECWRPESNARDYTWQDVFSDAVQMARSVGFWIRRILPEDVADLIVVSTIKELVTMGPSCDE